MQAKQALLKEDYDSQLTGIKPNLYYKWLLKLKNKTL